MTTTLYQPLQERLDELGDNLCADAKDLARAANGSAGPTIPSPTGYALLGNLKAALWYLGEVVEHLPNGLDQSLSDPRIRVYDRSPDGVERDPVAQVRLAGEHLRALHRALADAAASAELAQSAIAGQGWDPAQP